MHKCHPGSRIKVVEEQPGPGMHSSDKFHASYSFMSSRLFLLQYLFSKHFRPTTWERVSAHRDKRKHVLKEEERTVCFGWCFRDVKEEIGFRISGMWCEKWCGYEPYVYEGKRWYWSTDDKKKKANKTQGPYNDFWF